MTGPLARPHVVHALRRVAALPSPRVLSQTRTLSSLRGGARGSDANRTVRPPHLYFFGFGLAAASLGLAAYTRDPVYLDAPVPAPVATFHLDASTSLPLPCEIPLPLSVTATVTDDGRQPLGETMRLVASGVRTVSFLRVQVYVAALYVPSSALRDLKTQAQAQAQTERPGESPSPTLEETMARTLSSGVPAVLRIVPVRNTDFAHLRDGFARAVQQRVKALRRGGGPGAPTEEQEEALAGGVQQLKECFPKASLKKGEELDLVFHPSASVGGGAQGGVDLSLEYKGQVVGTVRHTAAAGRLDVAELLLQAYVADKDPVSEVFKKALMAELSRR